MKMTPLTLAMAAAAVALAGCDSRANKYENLCREFATLVEKDGNGIKVSIDEIAAGNCYTALFIPWDSDKIFVEGCPDDRNVWSYIIDINTKEAIQLPTNEGLIAIDPGKREIHMSNYLYHPEGGRYSVERVYTLDGKFTGKEYRIPD